MAKSWSRVARSAVLSLSLPAAVIGGVGLGAWALSADPMPDTPKPDVKIVAPGELKTAVEPKPLSDAVKIGLKYLIEVQQADGGWNQGGGWRTGTQGRNGGRVEGADVQDPSDMGNTCIALLAFFRAGHTATAGDYKDQVKKGLAFVFERIEKADDKDLFVTDVRNTQLQSKIGPYADTFLAALLLGETKGYVGNDETRLVKCLDKTIGKMGKNQQKDGTFAGNGGWAPVLSQGLANKALARGKQNGATVDDEVLARCTTQSRNAGNGNAAGAKVADAGVPLYSGGQAGGNLQDVVNSANVVAAKARETVADPKASKEDKDRAEGKIADAEKLEGDSRTARRGVAEQTKGDSFVRGFGSNGGEEFLSFLNISEMLVVGGGKDWETWDKKMQDSLPKAQDKNGSWNGHHCITGRTFCTASAILVLTADRAKFPEAVIKAAREDAKKAVDAVPPAPKK